MEKEKRYRLKLDSNNCISIKSEPERGFTIRNISIEKAAKKFALELFKYPNDGYGTFPSELQQSVMIGFTEGIKWAKQNLKL